MPGVNGVVQLSAHQLRSRPAENPLRSRIHQGDALFAVGDEDGVRRAIGYRGEQAELFGELLLDALAGGVMSVPKVWNETILPASSKKP